jgi:ubiquinone/menaquinone biosynthesis C-methylase UbiE
LRELSSSRVALGVLALLLPLPAASCTKRAAEPTQTTQSSQPAPAAHVDDAAALASLDRYRQPERLIAALSLVEGQRVADVGAGRGYLTFRLAAAVGKKGRVVATDIDDGALEALRAHTPKMENVVVRKVAPTEPGLEPASFDLILLSEVDHYLADRVAYLGKLRAALAPGGRIAVTNRRVFRKPLVEAAGQAGYRLVNEFNELPAHFLVFLRPAENRAETVPEK